MPRSEPVTCFITSILLSTLRAFDLTLTASGKDHKLSNLRSVKTWRVLIDAVDSELLYLINRRAELAIEAGRVKKSAGLPIWDSQRERDVIARMCQANAGPLDNTAIAKSFRRIIHETRRIEMRFAQSEYARDQIKIEEMHQSGSAT
jgi:chorismate mutase